MQSMLSKFEVYVCVKNTTRACLDKLFQNVCFKN